MPLYSLGPGYRTTADDRLARNKLRGQANIRSRVSSESNVVTLPTSLPLPLRRVSGQAITTPLTPPLDSLLNNGSLLDLDNMVLELYALIQIHSGIDW